LEREEKKAAEKWWRLEDAIEKAARRFNESMFRPSPSLETAGALGALPPGAAVWNLQDLHVGASFSASGLTAEEYIEQIVEAFRDGLRKARRNADLSRLYLVVGGDLVHVDNWQGETTSGTPQDLIMSPDEALEESIELLVRLVELARQVAGEIRLVPVRGNHDRMLGLAAAHAVNQHFCSEDDVMMLDTRERIYDAYGDHLLLFTHQLPKQKLKRIGDIITAEARSLLGETRYTTVYLGHLHFQAKDLEDISGRLTQQAPAPKRADRWHEKKGHVGSRKALQMHLIEPDSVNDATFSLAA
jgi:3',5'-cyclic AMP phosphodiesterase CpdA